MQNTLDYYNQNAGKFIHSTKDIDFHEVQDRFLEKLPAGARILDFGCGSGRDTRYFHSRGYCVAAIDGSEEMCRIARDYTGLAVKQMLFEKLDETEAYDGIWACSSILHLPGSRLADMLERMARALKNGGIIYTSFKYGSFEGCRNGRYFTDMTQDSFAELLEKAGSLELEEQWVTKDVRPERGAEQWLNVILRKE